MAARKPVNTLTIHSGETFDTPFEANCVATSDSDKFGNFTALDSDKVECAFNTCMVKVVHK